MNINYERGVIEISGTEYPLSAAAYKHATTSRPMQTKATHYGGLGLDNSSNTFSRGDTTTSGTTPAVNRIILSPIYIPGRCRVTEVSVYQYSTPIAGNAKIGFYSYGTDGQPDTKLYESSDIDTNVSTGQKKVTGLTWDFDPGWYWAGVITSASVQFYAADTDSTGAPCIPFLGSYVSGTNVVRGNDSYRYDNASYAFPSDLTGLGDAAPFTVNNPGPVFVGLTTLAHIP